MALQGTLDTFALADLVRLLATTSKTGELAIDGDRGAGRLWFVDGQLVGGEPTADDLVDVLFALLRTTDGDFEFAIDVTAPDAREPRSALDVLAAAEARLEEWAPVEALVPSPAVAVSLRDEIEGDEVTIDRATWRRLVAVAASVTAGDVATRLELDEQATAFALRDLVEAGLVEVGDEVVADDPIADEPTPVAPLALVPDPVVEAEPAATPDPLAAELPGLEVEPPYSFGGDAAEPAPEDEVVIAEPAARDGWEPLIPPVEPGLAADDLLPAPDPAPAPAPAADLGSYAVDLDDATASDPAGHRYLGRTEGPQGLPEPLLEALPEALPEPAPAAEAAPDGDDAPAWSAPAERPDDLGVPLDSLSPAAARALAAAAQADDQADETDAGRRVLRRIISTGKG